MITWKDPVKPIGSKSGRPVDDSYSISEKIKEKSEKEKEDVSLRTLSNMYIAEILQSISLLPSDKLPIYLRNP
jgi:hypothetical protein